MEIKRREIVATVNSPVPVMFKTGVAKVTPYPGWKIRIDENGVIHHEQDNGNKTASPE